MCCPGRACMLCTCLILVAIAIGFFFGFSVYKDGFRKLKDTFHEEEYMRVRPYLYAPPPAGF